MSSKKELFDKIAILKKVLSDVEIEISMLNTLEQDDGANVEYCVNNDKKCPYCGKDI